MAAKLSAGSVGISGSKPIWRRSTRSTTATRRSSRDPKWCNSIRWLVPTAAAMSRRERSPTPPAANSSTSASSNCRRRSRSGVRAIGAAELLRPGLESVGLQFEEALGLLDHQPPDEGTEYATLVELLAHQGAAVGLGDDPVPSAHPHAGRPLHPRPGRARVDFGDLPDELRHAGLLDGEPFADGQTGAIPRNQRTHRRRPVGPTLDVAEDLPHQLGRRVNLDAVFGNHVPNGTSSGRFFLCPYPTRALSCLRAASAPFQPGMPVTPGPGCVH